METVRVLETPFVPWALLAEFETAEAEKSGRFGATAVFVGTMRNHNQGEVVREMLLEHYPAMTAKELSRIRSQAMQHWPLDQLLLVHRVGRLVPGEPIMLVAAWSAHRQDALAACQHVVEELKARAPFWKKETRAGGERWVAP